MKKTNAPALLIANTYDGKSLSGLDPCEIKNCKVARIDNFFEYFTTPCYMVLGHDKKEAQKLIIQMAAFEDIGDFLDDDIPQRKELAAYTLIVVDRLIRAAKNGSDGWKAMKYFYQLYEAMMYLDGDWSTVSFNARKAARSRHAENRDMKNQIFEWYKENGNKFPSMNAAAETAIKIVPVKFRTARNWIGEFRKIIDD